MTNRNIRQKRQVGDIVIIDLEKFKGVRNLINENANENQPMDGIGS
jgi:hypothetical protein